ncbi:MAG: hypothetical protein KC441_15205 [Anaerolineales bacterium]|nr:hypothetical protein [Anaerolineales bacterium]
MVKKLAYMLLGGVIALAIVFGGFAVYAQTTDEGEATPEAVPGDTIQDGTAPIRPFHGVPGLDGRGGRGGLDVDNQAFLADALGITTEELQTAQDSARTARIEQAVADGLLTQEQADALLNGETGFRGEFGFGGRGHDVNGPDNDTYLADALGISVEELQAAKEAAHAAALQQAVDEGLITQEQADLMNAAQALHDAVDEDAVMAEALGVTVEEFQAAKEAHTVQDLIDASGLTNEELMTAVQTARDAAVQQAVADGVITQEQADALANTPGFGLDGFGGPRGGHGGHGGPGGFAPGDCAPSTAPDSTTTPDTTNPAPTTSSSNA